MKPQGWTAAGAATATVLLTGFAFWLSYEHLHDVSASNGLAGSRAWAWPATVDLFIMIGELLMLRASLIARGVDWWAVTLTVAGSGASIALNVAGVGKNAPTLTYVVAAVPPVAALLAFGALMRQVHDHLAEPVEPEVLETAHLPELAEVPAEPEPEQVTLERVEAEPETLSNIQDFRLLGPLVPVAELLAGTSHDQRETLPFAGTKAFTEPAPVPAEPPAPQPDPVPEPAEPEPELIEVPPGVSAEHVTLARLWLKTNPKTTGTEIGTRLGTSDSYGRRVRRAALTLETTS